MKSAVVRFAGLVGVPVLTAIGFIVVAVLLRGQTISSWYSLNPDEGELIAQARAALLSPVPFTTWTMGTTGPFWVLFLALIGAFGFPLTIAFAHLLAAALVGMSGYVFFVLTRRVLGLWQGLVVSLLWWLPFVLVFPLGGRVDFGALNTELLPCLLLLVAALFPTAALRDRPWLFLFVGALCALAAGSKYQVLPLAVALLAVQLLSLRIPLVRCIRPALWWGLGFMAPLVGIVLAVVISPDVSWVLVQQNLGFLGSYAGGVSIGAKIANTVALLATQKFIWGALLIVARLFWISDARTRVARVVLIGAGLAAVVAGGMGFGHYLIILYCAFALATALPVKPGTQLLPWPRARMVAVPVLAVLTAAVIVIGLLTGHSRISSPAQALAGLSADSVVRDSRVTAVCPPGSLVLIWGWAPEFYSNYDWQNSVPFMSSIALTANPTNLASGKPLVWDALADSDCVVDAVGAPFFGSDPGIASVYPDAQAVLEADYRRVDGVFDCDSCAIWMRR